VVGYSEQRDEPSDFIEGRKFFDYLRDCNLLKKESTLCSQFVG
jgi:hypothetical protein